MMVRDKKLSSEEALQWAAKKEAEEKPWELSNATQIKILTLVRDGKLNKEEAIAEARRQEAEEQRAKEMEAKERSVQEFYSILNQIAELNGDGD